MFENRLFLVIKQAAALGIGDLALAGWVQACSRVSLGFLVFAG